MANLKQPMANLKTTTVRFSSAQRAGFSILKTTISCLSNRHQTHPFTLSAEILSGESSSAYPAIYICVTAVVPCPFCAGEFPRNGRFTRFIVAAKTRFGSEPKTV